MAAAMMVTAPGWPVTKTAAMMAHRKMKMIARPGVTKPRLRRPVASSIVASLSRSLSRVGLR
jgi:hypothetical protein